MGGMPPSYAERRVTPVVDLGAQRDCDLEAYGEIVRRFQDMAVGYASAILKDAHLAEDVAREEFDRHAFAASPVGVSMTARAAVRWVIRDMAVLAG